VAKHSVEHSIHTFSLTVSEEEDSDTFAHPNIKIDGVRKECYRKPMEVNTDFNLQQCSPDVTKLKADHQPNDDCIRLIQSRVDGNSPEDESMKPQYPTEDNHQEAPQ